MLLELGCSGKRERVKEEGEGIFIAPSPHVTVICVFCEFRIIRDILGSFGWVTEYAKTHLKTLRSGSSDIGPDHSISLKILLF